MADPIVTTAPVRLRTLLPPRATWIFFGWVVAAWALRAPGCGFGLPYLWHPDESQIANRALHMLQTNSLDPNFFNYPSLTFYLHVVGTALWYMGEAAGPHPPALNSIPTWWDTGFYHTIGEPALWLHERRLTAAVGSVGVGLVWLFARRLLSPAGAVLAAAMVLFSPQHAELSRFITVDVPGATLVTATLLATLAIDERGELRHFLVAGFLGGLAMSTKYNLVSAALAPTFMWLLSRRRDATWAHAAAGVGATAFGLVLATPWFLLKPGQVLTQMAAEITHYMGVDPTSVNPEIEASGTFTARPGLDQLEHMASYILTRQLPGWALLTLVGVVVLGRRQPRIALVLGLFVATQVGQLARAYVFFHRNLVPMLPVFAVFAAAGAEGLWAALAGRLRVLRVPLVITILAPAAVSIHDLVTLRGRVDSRVKVAEFVQELGPDAVVAVPMELRLVPDTFGEARTLPVSLAHETPGDWASRGATHVIGGARMRVTAETHGYTRAQIEQQDQWFAAQTPIFSAGAGRWILDGFAIEPEVGVYVLAPPTTAPTVEAAASDAEAATPAAPNAPIPPDLGAEVDAPENWKIVPKTYAGVKVTISNGQQMLMLPTTNPPALSCVNQMVQSPRRVHVTGRLKGLGLPASGKAAAVTARFYDAKGALMPRATGQPAPVQAASRAAGTTDWVQVDRWLDAPEGTAAATVCVEAWPGVGSLLADDVHIDAVE